jgi:hypothetical protein
VLGRSLPVLGPRFTLPPPCTDATYCVGLCHRHVSGNSGGPLARHASAACQSACPPGHHAAAIGNRHGPPGDHVGVAGYRPCALARHHSAASNRLGPPNHHVGALTTAWLVLGVLGLIILVLVLMSMCGFPALALVALISACSNFLTALVLIAGLWSAA